MNNSRNIKVEAYTYLAITSIKPFNVIKYITSDDEKKRIHMFYEIMSRVYQAIPVGQMSPHNSKDDVKFQSLTETEETLIKRLAIFENTFIVFRVPKTINFKLTSELDKCKLNFSNASLQVEKFTMIVAGDEKMLVLLLL